MSSGRVPQAGGDGGSPSRIRRGIVWVVLIGDCVLQQKVEAGEYGREAGGNSCTWQKVWWSRNLGMLSYYVGFVAGYEISHFAVFFVLMNSNMDETRYLHATTAFISRVWH